MMSTLKAPISTVAGRGRRALAALNGPWHRFGMLSFLVVVLAHWAEHIAQAIQIWGLGWPVPKARGVLGVPFPWLVTSEWLHYGYALVMLVGLIVLRPGLTGRARTAWTVALIIQTWHHFEHLLLLLQVLGGWHLLGRPVATSVLQLFYPRVQLHLFYNAIVFTPMVIAMYLHLRPNRQERALQACTCAPDPASRRNRVGAPAAADAA